MDPRLSSLLPPAFRRRCGGVLLTLLARATLNFAGLALLVPVLMLILQPGGIRANTWLERLYDGLGFTDEGAFRLAVCGAVVAIILLKNLAGTALYRVERNFVYDLYRNLSRRLYVGYHARGMAFMKSHNSAVLARNVNVVCLTFVTGVLMPLATIAGEALLFALLFGAMLCYDAAAAGIALLVFLPATTAYYLLVRRRLSRYGEAENRAQRARARTVIETFRGYADIELSDAFPQQLARFDRTTEEVITIRRRNATLGQLPAMFTEVGLAAGMALLAAVGGTTGDGRMQLLFGVFAVAALRLMPSIRNILSSWTALRYNRYTADLLAEALADEVSAPPADNDRERLPLRHEIRVEHLSFRFPDAPQREVLHDLSLTIRRGERLGIRGRSGAGKTTLFNLLLGFYAPTSGRILIDSEPLTAANRRRWQNAVGYVSQSVFLTDGSFAQNVALGTPAAEIDRQRVREALRRARLDELIDALPRGIDTPVGECGCRLSGGQRQRIGIARALYKEAGILFFDEATSALDDRTEQEINRSIEELSRDNRELTLVVIAHRESSLACCDRILTLEE